MRTRMPKAVGFGRGPPKHGTCGPRPAGSGLHNMKNCIIVQDML